MHSRGGIKREDSFPLALSLSQFESALNLALRAVSKESQLFFFLQLRAEIASATSLELCRRHRPKYGCVCHCSTHSLCSHFSSSFGQVLALLLLNTSSAVKS